MKALVILLICCSSSLATAASSRDRLSQAREEYIGQEYERVIKLLAPLVASPTTTISDKVEAYELLGLSYLILDDTRRAQEAFENLLALDPGHVLRDPSGSPKLRRFFESVKQSFVPGYQPRARVGLEHATPSGALAGRPIELAAIVVQGQKDVAEVLLRWRRSGLLSYESVQLRPRGAQLVARFVLPSDPSGYRLEYYLEARDRAAQVLTRVGSPERPLPLEVVGSGVQQTSTPIYRRWWFWTVIGVVVVGGATTAGVLLSVDKVPAGNLEPGIIQLR